MSTQLHLSDEGYEFIVASEGKHKSIGGGRYLAYQCPAGVWTIYAGVTKGVHEGMIVTEEQGRAMFRQELSEIEAAVHRAVTVPIHQGHFDALVSFTYNLGEGNLRKSTLLKKINRRDFDGAEAEFSKWNKARVKGHLTVLRGLVTRRKREAMLFASGTLAIEEAEALAREGVEGMPQAVSESKPLPTATMMKVGAGVTTGVGAAEAAKATPASVWDQGFSVLGQMGAFAMAKPLTVLAILGGTGTLLYLSSLARGNR